MSGKRTMKDNSLQNGMFRFSTISKGPRVNTLKKNMGLTANSLCQLHQYTLHCLYDSPAYVDHQFGGCWNTGMVQTMEEETEMGSAVSTTGECQDLNPPAAEMGEHVQ